MNLANKLTMVRVALIPVFVVCMIFDFKYHMGIALAVFVVAALTDYIDGYIARKHNLVTDFGKFMDPLADKLLTSAAFILLTEAGIIPGWIVFTILAREFAVTGLRGIGATQHVVIAASSYGKAKTVTQMLTIIVLLMNNWPFSLINVPMGMILIYATLIATVLSGVDYFWKNRKLLTANM